ncbi:alpha/beta hydrolase [Williamsia sterculiae]|nr:alpha/beta hydrolase family protein [Williamsia sterculiae]
MNWHVRVRTLIVAASAIVAMSVTTGPASAGPGADAPSSDGSHLVSLTRGEGRQADAIVYSAAMDRNIALKLLIAPGSAPRPTMYILDGVGGGKGNNLMMTWGRAQPFLSDKDVNVVATVGGDSSYFTDWKRDDPRLGRQKWATFLTEELPPIVDATLNTTRRNALVGISMSGTSSLALAIRKPGLFQAVSSMSGCAQTSDPLGQAYVNVTVSDFGGDVDNMWGAPDDPLWTRNDPYLHADALRGTTLYISNGSGLPGRYDNLQAPNVHGEVGQLIAQLTVGGVIEAATNQCSHNLQARLHSLGIPATFDLRPTGTHSWDYWAEDFRKSYPVLHAAITD